MTDIDRALVEQAIARDRRAVRTLIRSLSPVVQSRVARVLLRRGAAQARDVREEVKDLTQHVFALLFDNEGRILRQWNPSRGMSLINFVGLVADHEVRVILRSRRKSPWTEEPVETEDLDQGEERAGDPEQVIASKQILLAILQEVRAQLSDVGLELFEMLFIEGRSVEEVCEVTGKSADAIYAWRSRLGKLAKKMAEKIVSDPQELSRSPRTSHEDP